MQTVYFITLSEDDAFRVEASEQSDEAQQNGFMHGAVFIQPWAIFQTEDDAYKQLVRTVLEVGGGIIDLTG